MDAIGAEITNTTTRTLYWVLTTDDTIPGNPRVAILPIGTRPSAATVWATATWTGPEVVEGTTHTRRLSLLVAGPNGPTTGSPTILPAKGEYQTWVRFDTATERVETKAQLLAVI